MHIVTVCRILLGYLFLFLILLFDAASTWFHDVAFSFVSKAKHKKAFVKESKKFTSNQWVTVTLITNQVDDRRVHILVPRH